MMLMKHTTKAQHALCNILTAYFSRTLPSLGKRAVYVLVRSFAPIYVLAYHYAMRRVQPSYHLRKSGLTESRYVDLPVERYC